jgi:plastocyanin
MPAPLPTIVLNLRSGLLLSVLLLASCSKPRDDAPSAAPPLPASAQVASAHVVMVAAPPADSGSPVVVVLEPTPLRDLPVEGDSPVMNQVGKMFSPEVLFARIGQAVEFRNDDDTLHNVNVKDDTTKEQLFNVAIIEESAYHYSFERPGLYSVHCDIHQAMFSIIVVSNSPYARIADADGTARFDDVLPGGYTATVYAGTRKLERGFSVSGPRTEITVKN